MNETDIEVNFPKLNHFWMDSGLVGLYQIAKQEHPAEIGIEIKLDDEGLWLKGLEKNVNTFLHKTYDALLTQYYNTSTLKQKTEKRGFYYDSVEDKFVRVPKVKSMGIAGLIFNKGSGYKPTKKQVKYIKDAMKKGTLPVEYAHLQERLDDFLSETGLKIGSSSLLIDGPNAIRPKVNISVKPRKTKGNCFICGETSHSLSEIGGTVFPMISGSSGALSFNSGARRPASVCWKCDFVAKFVPVNGFYTLNLNDKGKIRDYHMYFPYSASLEKMNGVYGDLQSSIKFEDPNLFRNFNHQLGGYFQKPFEQLFAFLYSLYRIVMTSNSSSDSSEEISVLDYEKLYGIALSKAPLEFFILHTEALGDTQMGKMIWAFQDLVYITRLFECMEKHRIDIRSSMNLLVDFDQKKNENKTIIRNRVCKRILEKQSILNLVEQHVFRINKSKIKYIKPLHDFVIEYEKILREEGDKMNQNIVDTAVSLGKTIGKSVGPSGKKGKGDLFRLRKARTIEVFLNEINRIQMKYNALIPAGLYNEGQKVGENFDEFKQFCMVSALNTFNAMNREDQNKNSNEKNKEVKK